MSSAIPTLTEFTFVLENWGHHECKGCGENTDGSVVDALLLSLPRRLVHAIPSLRRITTQLESEDPVPYIIEAEELLRAKTTQ